MKTNFSTLLFLLFALSVGAQETNTDNYLPEAIPPSPTASNLGMYAEIPIGFATGTPQIDIPIWTIKVQDFELPVSLSYHASGIKVNQESSNVGLGWSLNSGGVITRTIYGQDDMTKRITSAYEYPEFDAILTPELFSSLYDDNLIELFPEYDMQPDIYHFNFNGRSGKFILKQNGEAVLFPHQDLYVKLTAQGFLIIDEKGIRYSFEDHETTASIPEYTAHLGSSPMVLSNPEATTGYYLSKIELLHGDAITFNYFAENYTYSSPPSRTKKYNQYYADLKTDLETKVNHTVKGKNPSSIVWDQGRIEFDQTERTDLLALDQANKPKRITAIKVFQNGQQTPIRRYELDQEYFNAQVGQDAVEIAENARLKLNGISACGASGECNPPYQFYYDESVDLPNKVTGPRDHYGYYRGAGSFFNVPRLLTTPQNGINYYQNQFLRWNTYSGGAIMATPFFIAYSDRDPSFPDMQAGTLLKISYPTGGHTDFEFEPHYFSRSSLSSAPFEWLDEKSETVSISGTMTQTEMQQTFTSINPVVISFWIQGAVNDCFDFSCNGDPCLKSECIDKYGGNRIRVVDNSTGNDVFDLIYDQFGNQVDNMYLYSGSSCGGFLGLNAYDSQVDDQCLVLAPGDYTLVVSRGNNTETISATLNSYDIITEDPLEGLTDIMAGGLRIKRKTDWDSTRQIKQIDYEYSEGVLYDQPQYHDFTVSYKHNEKGPHISPYKSSVTSVNVEDRFIQINSGKSNVLTASQITYQNVAVKETSPGNQSENGFKVHTFKPRSNYNYYSSRKGIAFSSCTICVNASTPVSNPYDCIDSEGAIFDQHLTGSLIPTYPTIYESTPRADSVSIYTKDSSLLKTEIYKYDYYSRDTILGFELNVIPVMIDNVANDFDDPCSFSGITYTENTWYRLINGYHQLSNKKTKEYFPSGQVNTDVDYTYASTDHIAPTYIEKTNSDGTVMSTNLIYPSDIVELVPSEMYDTSKVNYKHMNSQWVLREVFDDENLIGKTIKSFSYSIAKDLMLNDSIQHYPKGDLEDKQVYHYRYNDNGRLIELYKSDDVVTTYIWGYNQAYPVAKVVGATYAQVEGVTGFGVGFSLGDGTITATQQSNLRRELSDAMVSIFTYEPLIGMINQVDANGKVTSFEYDDFGRIWLEKNNEGSIVKQYEYYYRITSNE